MKFFIACLIFILFNSVSFSQEDKLPFELKIVGDNENLNNFVHSTFDELINDQEGIRYNSEDERAAVDLYVYVLEHTNSNQEENVISFSIAHTHYRNIVNVVNEVFAENSDISEELEYYSAGLITEGGGQFMYISNALADNESQIDTVVQSILNDLSLRISEYYFGSD